MNYLNKFNSNLLMGIIPIRNDYIDHHFTDQKQFIGDVVTDLTSGNKMMASACLPIAKQIIIRDKKININLPKIGDLFIGIVNNDNIDSVLVTLSNYTSEYTFECEKSTVGKHQIWRFSKLPLVLLNIVDYENISVNIQITTNKNYCLQNSNRDVFEACYGYFNENIKQEMLRNVIYHIPLINNKSTLKIVCGMWYVKGATAP